MNKIYKTLTRNDTGETHSHQSGITIPSFAANSGIFPDLGILTLNPREEVVFYDDNNTAWKFQYIYYNDVYFGKPKSKAHNEHRLTCTLQFIREYGIKSGDDICFSIDDNGVRHIGYVKKDQQKDFSEQEGTVIKLRAGWHYIKM